MRVVLFVALLYLAAVEPSIAEIDAWNPNGIHPDWQTITRLQRVPLFDKEFDERVDLVEFIQHETPMIRLAAASAIVQSEEERLYDHVLNLCRDDWPFIAEKSLELLMRAKDKRWNRRLVRAGSFPDWQLRRRKPYSQIYHALGLSTSFTPNSYWQWHDAMLKLRAGVQTGREIARANGGSLMGLPARSSIGNLDRSIAHPGDKIIYRIQRHQRSGFDLRIQGFYGALEQGNLKSATDWWDTWIQGPMSVEERRAYYEKLR